MCNMGPSSQLPTGRQNEIKYWKNSYMQLVREVLHTKTLVSDGHSTLEISQHLQKVHKDFALAQHEGVKK